MIDCFQILLSIFNLRRYAEEARMNAEEARLNAELGDPLGAGEQIADPQTPRAAAEWARLDAEEVGPGGQCSIARHVIHRTFELRLLNYTTSFDVASNIRQTLGRGTAGRGAVRL